MLKRWMYPLAIVDWYSRYVIGWELDQTLERLCAVPAVQRALAGHSCDLEEQPGTSLYKSTLSAIAARCAYSDEYR